MNRDEIKNIIIKHAEDIKIVINDNEINEYIKLLEHPIINVSNDILKFDLNKWEKYDHEIIDNKNGRLRTDEEVKNNNENLFNNVEKIENNLVRIKNE